jgi:hypothetical protein
MRKKDKKLLDFKGPLTSPPIIIVGGGWFVWCPLALAPIVTCTHKVGRTVQNRTIDYNMGKRMFEQEEEEEKYEKDEAAEDEGLEFFRLLLVFIMMPFISYTGIFFLLCSFLFSFIFLANRFHQKERDTQSRFRHRHHKPKSEKGPTAATVVAIHPSIQQQLLFFSKSKFLFRKTVE